MISFSPQKSSCDVVPLFPFYGCGKGTREAGEWFQVTQLDSNRTRTRIVGWEFLGAEPQEALSRALSSWEFVRPPWGAEGRGTGKTGFCPLSQAHPLGSRLTHDLSLLNGTKTTSPCSEWLYLEVISSARLTMTLEMDETQDISHPELDGNWQVSDLKFLTATHRLLLIWTRTLQPGNSAELNVDN